MTPLGSIKRQLYVLALIDEAGPLLALYTLWFDNHGITAGQISLVFVLWAAIGVVLEVPSGALADRIDRRRLVAGAVVLRALGIAVWLVWPTFPGMIVGASLWAIHTAVASGTWEAMVFDQIRATGNQDKYPVVMARVGQCSHLGTAVGTLGATALVSAGAGLDWLGWITVVMHLPALAILLTLPNAEALTDDQQSYSSWWATLKGGARTALRQANLKHLVIIAAMLEGLFIIDEYVPLLARLRGASDSVAPLLVLAVWTGLLIGGEVAARFPALGRRALSLLLVTGVAAMAVGLASDALWAVGLIGIGYGVMNTVWILTEAQLQFRSPDAVRATVRSVVALFGAGLNALAFAVVGLMAIGPDPAPGLIAALSVLLVAALWIARRFGPPGGPARILAE